MNSNRIDGSLSPDPNLVCQANLTLREVLARLNASPILAQVVVDAADKVIGVITDGDARRALVRGIDLDAPVAQAMNSTPIVGLVGRDLANRGLLSQIRSVIHFLPIVDESGRLCRIWVDRVGSAPPIALIMAGGEGRRLGERTRTVPKPLLQVGGKRMIDHTLDRLEHAGVTQIYIAVHYLADQFEDYLATRGSRARIQLIYEELPLGTAGAIGLLPAVAQGPLLVTNADVVTSVALEAMFDFHTHQGYDATIAVARQETTIPFGVVHHDGQGHFSELSEKPTLVHFVAAGLYLIGTELRSAIAPGRRTDMPELLNTGRAMGMRVGLFPIHEYWRDLGRPDDLAAADGERQTFELKVQS